MESLLRVCCSRNLAIIATASFDAGSVGLFPEGVRQSLEHDQLSTNNVGR